MEDLSTGTDVRGDDALFIERKHFISEWELDDEVKTRFKTCEPTFFRVIENHEQQHGHGWLENGKIIQWG